MARINLQDAKREISLNRAFNAGNLTASWDFDGFFKGYYVVRSYGTVIGKISPSGEMTVTPIRYSVTTSKHTNMVKRAWGLL
jgi:hypothetical protein